MKPSHARAWRLLLALVLALGQLQPLVAGAAGSTAKPCDMHAGQQASMEHPAHTQGQPATEHWCPQHGAGAGCEIDCVDCSTCSPCQTGLLAVHELLPLLGAYWPLPPHQLALGPERTIDLRPPRYF